MKPGMMQKSRSGKRLFFVCVFVARALVLRSLFLLQIVSQRQFRVGVKHVDIVEVKGDSQFVANLRFRTWIGPGDEILAAAFQVDDNFVTHLFHNFNASRQVGWDYALRQEICIVDIFWTNTANDISANIAAEGCRLARRHVSA